MTAEMIETYYGYEVRTIRHGRMLYVAYYKPTDRNRNGYVFTTDHTYAKKYAKRTAAAHVKRLSAMEEA